MIEFFERFEKYDDARDFACEKSIENENVSYFVIGYVHADGQVWDVYEDSAPYCDEDFSFIDSRWMNGDDFLD